MYLFLGSLIIVCLTCESYTQIGPDPWDYENSVSLEVNKGDIPPDLAIPHKKSRTRNNAGIGDWFYKRLLAIVIKGGQIKKNEDGSVDVSLQMIYTKEQWDVLEELMVLNTVLSEDMYRRSMGLIEEAIYKPTITDKIIMAWHEYIQFNLIEYKAEITWTLSILAIIITSFWIWNHVSHKHVIITILVGLYLYEAFISYKEAEKQELEKFIKAVSVCKWFLWTSDCEVPPPDPLVFLKHMNPLKISIRMLSTIITEPMVLISDTIKIIIHGITDGLWYPFDKMMYGLLIITFNVLLIFFLIMIIFNYILNIPFNLNFLGIINVGLKQRNRYFNKSNTTALKIENEDKTSNHSDRISGETISRLLDVCSKALNTVETARRTVPNEPMIRYGPSNNTMKRSASTGRLNNNSASSELVASVLKDIPIKRNKKIQNGSGDAHFIL